MNPRYLLCLLVMTCVVGVCPALAQSPPGAAPSPPRLIVRADDMGYAHAGNEAILRCVRDGIATSVEVLVPSPWFPEAVQMLNAHTNVDVGLHITLTSEWDNVKWRPVAAVPSLQDTNGYLFPMVFPNKNYPGRSLAENKWKLEEIEREFRAQIELGRRNLPQVTHLSFHMGCSMLSPEVRSLAKRLAKEYGIDIDPAELGVRGVGYDGTSATSAEKRAAFERTLRRLEPGKTYLFVDHPGLDGAELQAIHHIGYEHVARDRQGVTDVWTDPGIRALIGSLGIRLISYADLRR